MYCRNCGYSMPDDATECPFCKSKVQNDSTTLHFEVNDENKTVSDQADLSSNTSTSTPSNQDNIANMAILRNHLGYVELKTKFWHHLLIACGGYLLMEILFTIIGTAMVAAYQANGFDFSCLQEHADDLSVCPVEVVNTYVKITSICQVVCELLILAVIVIIFRKYIKTFFKEAKDNQTWKWYGIGLGIMYGGNMLYSVILQGLGLESTSSNQDAVNDVIFTTPLLGLLFVVIAAPIFEELIFRFGIFRSFTGKDKKIEIIGLIVTTAIFAGVHMIATFQEVFADPAAPDYELLKSDMLTLPVYLIGAFGLTFAYYKSKNLMTTMAMHMTYNGISFIMILLMELADPGTSESIIHFLTRLLF